MQIGRIPGIILSSEVAKVAQEGYRSVGTVRRGSLPERVKICVTRQCSLPDVNLAGSARGKLRSHHFSLDHFDKARVPDCTVNNLGRRRVVDEGVIGARVQIPKRYCKCDSLDRSLGGLTVDFFLLVSSHPSTALPCMPNRGFD